jgi:hypothetical protein
MKGYNSGSYVTILQLLYLRGLILISCLTTTIFIENVCTYTKKALVGRQVKLEAKL